MEPEGSIDSSLDARSYASQHLTASAELKLQVARTGVDSIVEAAALLIKCFSLGNKVLICGNGGSAADAQHMSAEFVNRLSKEFDRPGLPAIALTTDTSLLTAYANDYGYEGLFERQVMALGCPNDVLIGISTSGNSANVIRGVNAARTRGLMTVGLLGSGGELTNLVDQAVVVPDRDTQHVQEALLAIEHIICRLVERALFPSVTTAPPR